MADVLTASELRRMAAWVKQNTIHPLHFESLADFRRFVEEQAAQGWDILSPEEFGLKPDGFPGDFYIVGKEGVMMYERATRAEQASNP